MPSNRPDAEGKNHAMQGAARVIVVMGVAGSGKTTVGERLAAALARPFVDGDDLHSPDNIAKMRQGQPLDDADRAPWLALVAAQVDRWLAAPDGGGVLACSVLKRAYRDRVIGARAGVALVYLQGSRALIAARVAARQGHFMPASLLESQFAALEEPAADERAIVVDVAGTPDDAVAATLRALDAHAAG